MRNNERDTFERRCQDRRQVDFIFASTEWVDHVKKDYVAWPKLDRRHNARRDGERRDNIQEFSGGFTTDYSSDLLSKEERLFFNELFTNKTH